MAERDLQGGVAHADADVVAVEGQQGLFGEEAEPEEGRHRGPRDVLAGATGDLEVGLLEDVGGIDAALGATVEAESDHPPQPLAVAGERLDQRPLVSYLEPAEQVVIVARVVVWHG
jgi:hypothetical protein